MKKFSILVLALLVSPLSQAENAAISAWRQAVKKDYQSPELTKEHVRSMQKDLVSESESLNFLIGKLNDEINKKEWSDCSVTSETAKEIAQKVRTPIGMYRAIKALAKAEKEGCSEVNDVLANFNFSQKMIFEGFQEANKLIEDPNFSNWLLADLPREIGLNHLCEVGKAQKMRNENKSKSELKKEVLSCYETVEIKS